VRFVCHKYQLRYALLQSNFRRANPVGFSLANMTKPSPAMSLLFIVLCLFSSMTTTANGQQEVDKPIIVEPIDYVDAADNDFPLKGYISYPESTPAPAVIVIVRMHEESQQPPSRTDLQKFSHSFFSLSITPL